MKPSESITKFEGQLDAAGHSLAELVPCMALDHMLSFYTTPPSASSEDGGQDMLLFEWGTYDWGEGQSFEVSLTRQFVEAETNGEERISQLRLVFHYQSTSEMDALGQGSRWCSSVNEAEEFDAFVRSNPAFLAVADLQSASVQLSHAYE